MDGDPRPYNIEAVLTTREKAIRLQPGTTAPNCEQSLPCADAPVYVVAMRGRFICNACSGPAGAPAPRGTVIELGIEGATLFNSEFGLSDRYPDLKAAGVVVRLDRSGRRFERRRRSRAAVGRP